MKKALVSIAYGVAGAIMLAAACAVCFCLLTFVSRTWGDEAVLALGAVTMFMLVASYIAARHYSK